MLQPSRQQGVKTAGRSSEEDGILKRATDGQPADAGGGGALPADNTRQPTTRESGLKSEDLRI